MLIDPGDPVIVELPTYSGAIAAFHNLQASLVGVPQDAEGIEIAAVDRVATDLATQGRPAKFIYVTPNFQNPAGLLMSAQRRRELIGRRAGGTTSSSSKTIPYGSIYFEDVTTFADTRPIKADDTDGRVIYLGSFSKILVPGLRVAWMVAPTGDGAESRALQAGRRHLERRLRSTHRAWRAGRRRDRSHRARAARALPGEAHASWNARSSHTCTAA